ncbi:MAG: formate--tetrahydrofolate ligase [Xanthomonadales bacterium]|jgi:formate--tetrahydrofolate ligase|nr:formate--tetrahydrofolate ligase [Xanthomonadales bacterium]
MLSDHEIARAAALKPIGDIADALDIAAEHRLPFGDDVCKIHMDALGTAPKGKGKLILVSATTPTPAGEGKTTTSIGLGQGLQHIGESVAVALREPSLGPCFGVKGGATGGGHAQMVPADRINLHFTGDFHAITSANNLIAAMLDNVLFQGNPLNLDPRQVLWRRVMDMNDRALRNLVLGIGGKMQGVPREGGFDITAASEIMAIVCLATDMDDLAERLDNILLGFTYDGEPVRAGALGITGALLALLKDAMHPNLVQTLEGVPVFVHGGPFANIAHGCNTVLATRMAMHHADWAVTEAGFGFDLGAEKFFDIKCRAAGLDPDAVVLVTTIRALKSHGGQPRDALETPNPDAVRAGLVNLDRHLESAAVFGKRPVVALNRFAADTDEEIAVVAEHVRGAGYRFAESRHFAEGGPGSADLAREVIASVEDNEALTFTYPAEANFHEKVEAVAKRIYGADGVVFTRDAEKDFAAIAGAGLGELPVCIAKTPASLSDDPALLGRPEGFDITVRNVQVSAGAGFLVALTGTILRMPGLPRSPQALKVRLNEDGSVEGVA